MNLYDASNQWANRPNDERFWNLSDARIAAEFYRSRARQAKVALNTLTAIDTEDGEIVLASRSGRETFLSHAGFEQISRFAGAPATYLRSLPAPITAQALNHGLSKCERDGNMLFHERDSGELVARCITSDKYERLWNLDVIDKLSALTDAGWKTPPARPAQNDPRARPATREDVLACCNAGIAVHEGMLIAPAGVYLSDHDFFVLLVYCDNPIDNGNGKPMYRGLIFKNNEVGTGSVSGRGFLFDGVCSNHIIWGAQLVFDFRFVHRKNVKAKAEANIIDVSTDYVNQSSRRIEADIMKARETVIAPNKDKLIDALFGQKLLSKSDLLSAYNYAESEAHVHNSDPLTVWGYTQGLTKYSQTFPHADRRNEIDGAASKLLSISF